MLSDNQDVRSQHTISVGSSSYKSVEDISTSASENSTVVTSKTASTVCCSCSKNSLCKTMKCKCRSKGGSCGASCGCAASKCSNRKATPIKSSDSPLSEIANGILNCSNTSETESSSIEASKGAMLLQSALVQKPAEPKENFGARKKPLTEIGNILVCFVILFELHFIFLGSLKFCSVIYKLFVLYRVLCFLLSNSVLTIYYMAGMSRFLFDKLSEFLF